MGATLADGRGRFGRGTDRGVDSLFGSTAGLEVDMREFVDCMVDMQKVFR